MTDTAARIWPFLSTQVIGNNWDKKWKTEFKDASIGIDISVCTKDCQEDDGHKLILAGFSSIMEENPTVDKIILTEWSMDDYSLLLELVYGEAERFVLKVILYNLYS